MLTKSKQMVFTGTIFHLQSKNFLVIVLGKQNMKNAGNFVSECKSSKKYGLLEPLGNGKIFTNICNQLYTLYTSIFITLIRKQRSFPHSRNSKTSSWSEGEQSFL